MSCRLGYLQPDSCRTRRKRCSWGARRTLGKYHSFLGRSDPMLRSSPFPGTTHPILGRTDPMLRSGPFLWTTRLVLGRTHPVQGVGHHLQGEPGAAPFSLR